MNLAEFMLREGFDALLCADAKCLQTVKAPVTGFKAIVSVANPFDPETELGSDPREKVLIEVKQPGPSLAVNDYVTEVGTTNKWQIVYRDDNKADFTIKYMGAAVLAIDT